VIEVVKVGATVKAVGSSTVETVVRVANVYGPAVVTDHGNVYLYGNYEVVDGGGYTIAARDSSGGVVVIAEVRKTSTA
jgi:hypothetical protein